MTDLKKYIEPAGKILFYAAVLSGFLLLSRYSYLLFHTVVEIFCIVISATIFILVWNTRKTLTNGYLIFIGIGQLFMSLWDVMHTLAYRGVQMFPGFDANLPTQLWIASRYFLAASLLVASFLINRRIRLRVWGSIYALVFLAVVASIFGGLFPDSFVEGGGLTPFKIISEFVIAVLFSAALIILILRRSSFDKTVFAWLVMFLVFNITSELFFTLYSTVTDIYNLLGHLFKLAAYYSLYKAIVEIGLIRPYALLYIDLVQKEQALRLSRDELQEAIARLSESNIHLSEAVKLKQEAETALEKYAARLEASNRELEQFAFVASHDLQEPLRKIKLFGEQIKAAAARGTLEEQDLDFVNRMVNASKRMETMIADLLELSRISTAVSRFERVNLNEALADVISDLEVRLSRTKGRVEVGYLPDVLGDPQQLRRLFLNLIGNALKFSRPEVPPVVQIRATPIEQEGSLMVSIEVQDNGIGFDEQYMPVIFEPFKRIHGRFEYEGSGMGLAICRRIVERHKGCITAHSTAGEGSTFVVELPVLHEWVEQDSDR